MTPFLYAVAEAFYNRYHRNISEITFVFPNRRAGLFFQKHLASLSDVPLFSPEITTINDLFFKLNGAQPADRIGMLFTLYRCYIRLSRSDESFDSFLFWGEMLLNDFDDIDKYNVDARQLFTNIKDLKEIEDKFYYLSESQIEAIRRFWTGFMAGQESSKKQEFIQLWERLYPLYTQFREELKKRHQAYEGMAFREVAEHIKEKSAHDFPYRKLVFVGLNALTETEKIVMKHLRTIGIADFYWDYYAPAIQDKENKASFFLQENRISFPSQLSLPDNDVWQMPQMEMIGVPSAVGQAKQTTDILQQLIDREEIQPDKAINTAVVLPDEQLLYPVLYSIPEPIDPINITMGYALSNSPVAGLMQNIMDLQKQVRFVQGNAQFYYRITLTLLTNPYLLASDRRAVSGLIADIKRYNKIFIDARELGVTELLKRLFVPVATAGEAADYLLDLLVLLQKQLGRTEDKEKEEAGSPDRLGLSKLEREFVYQYYITINRLKSVIDQESVPMAVDTFFKLAGKMMATISIPFQGEPLSGLQVMGVLETRALDFDYLIIPSMNEGIFPIKKVANTFIPHNLRKGFGLSTTQHQDSIYAYYFYRMICRAKRVYFLYDTRTEGLQTGEISRYLYQLKYLYRTPIAEKLVTYDIAVSKPATIRIEKSPHVMSLLDKYRKGGERALSASAINTYINCPLQFYLQYVEQLNDQDDVTESIEADMFGTLFHGAMEILYRPFEKKLVTADLLQSAERNEKWLTEVIELSFAQNYYRSEQRHKLTGRHYLIGEIIRKYVKQVLVRDRALTPFTYIESERLVNVDMTINNTLDVRLKAYIDRVDEKEGAVRIIDYKTGEGRLDYSTVEELFDPSLAKRPKAVMQVFLYAMLYHQQQPCDQIIPGIYYLRTLYRPDFEWRVINKQERIAKKIDNYANLNNSFKSELIRCIASIFNENEPFVQCESRDACRYCKFVTICNR